MTTSVTITAGLLADLVGPIIPLASKDQTLPILNAVLIEKRGDYLTATATDRYRLGVKRRKVEGGDGFRALVSVTDLRRVLSAQKATKRNDPPLTLTAEPLSLLVEHAEGSLRVPFVDGAYPNVLPLFHGAFTAPRAQESRAALSVDGDFLADFRHAGSRDAPLRMWRVENAKAAGDMLAVSTGPDFFGLLMSVTMPDATDIRDDKSWAEILGLPETKGAAA